jgi:pimeloyl-ACP methyl ester carboxylesterase
MIVKQHYTIPGAKGRGMTADITYRTSQPYAPLVIFAHGIRGFKDWGAHNLVAKYFAESGFRFLKFNFSHNGTTADKPTEFADLIAFSDNTFTIELEDLKSVIDFACGGSAIPRVSNVYLIGHSMGGGISIIKTAEDTRIQKLVTMAAICSFHNLWPKEAEQQWRLQGVMYMKNARTGQNMPYKSSLLRDLDEHADRLDILLKASQIKQPWLIIHGDADKSVPLAHGEMLHTAQPPAEFLSVPGADHTFNVSHPHTSSELSPELLLFCDAALSFFKG